MYLFASCLSFGNVYATLSTSATFYRQTVTFFCYFLAIILTECQYYQKKTPQKILCRSYMLQRISLGILYSIIFNKMTNDSSYQRHTFYWLSSQNTDGSDPDLGLRGKQSNGGDNNFICWQAVDVSPSLSNTLPSL